MALTRAEIQLRYRRRHPERAREYARRANNSPAGKANHARHRARKRAFINAAKDVPCADCGVRFPTCAMDFDHVRGTKAFNIGNTLVSFARLETEIAKCEVVCSNCHRIRTHERK